MAPIAKDSDVSVSNPPVPAASAQKAQPVALEVPVVVNGARTVEGSDKREPFSEDTKTVLVFGNGAVMRLTSTVAPGQLLFVSNEKTKREVICQVVKSKNYRSVSGYVEVEFTEPAPGFWGMRFPGDHLNPNAQASTPSAVPAKPAAPKPAVSTPVNVAPPAIPPAPVKASVPVTPAANTPAFASASELLATSEVRPVQQNAAGPAQEPVAATPAKNTESESLKNETARLQEQLSSLLFAEAPSKKEETSAVDAKQIAEASNKIFEMAAPKEAAEAPKTESQATETPARASEAGKVTPITSAAKPEPPKRAIDMTTEEMSVPSWLEPLARNSSPSSASGSSGKSENLNAVTPSTSKDSFVAQTEVVETVAAQVAGEGYEPADQPSIVSEAILAGEAPAPNFGTGLSFGANEESSTPAEGGSKKGLWIGLVAATLLLAVGGYWYTTQSGKTLASTATTAAATSAPAQTLNNSSQAVSAPNTASTTTPSATQNVQSNVPATNLATPATTAAAISTKNQNSTLQNESLKVPVGKNSLVAANKEPDQVEEVKKPNLGDVRLAAPVANRSSSRMDAEAPGMTPEGAPEVSGNALAAGLGGKQPKVPLPVGGDVKPARLVSSVAPTYPSLARSQRVAGDVNVDALIDVNGRVSTMRVISGPTILHQAAMDALKQWRYQPATLNGEAVPMHLTVTIQFRVQ